MQQIIKFILRYTNFLLYILLLIIALSFTIQTHSYHQSKFFNSSSWLTGTIYEASSGITSYFDLKKENESLLKDNEALRNLLLNKKESSVRIDSAKQKFVITAGRVIKNSFANPRNYITINKGEKDGIRADMGVISSKGILGIVENTSKGFATVQSILNENSSINAKLKNTNHFGSLIWDAKNYRTVQLVDMPRLVPLVVGDTIVTGAMSSIFPENIPIGTIKKFDLNESQSFWRIEVDLFNDMTNLKNIYVVENKNRQEIIELEENTEN